MKQLPSLLTDQKPKVAKSRAPAKKSSRSAKTPPSAKKTTPKSTLPDGSHVMVVIQARRVVVQNGQETWVPLNTWDLPLNNDADLSQACLKLAGVRVEHTRPE